MKHNSRTNIDIHTQRHTQLTSKEITNEMTNQ